MTIPSRTQLKSAYDATILLADVATADSGGWVRVSSPVFDPVDYPVGSTLNLEACLETTNIAFNAQMRLMDGVTQMASIQTISSVPILISGVIGNIPVAKTLLSLELRLEAGAPAPDIATASFARIEIS